VHWCHGCAKLIRAGMNLPGPFVTSGLFFSSCSHPHQIRVLPRLTGIRVQSDDMGEASCAADSPEPTLRNTKRCRNRHFSAGEMKIPANVRSSWRGVWGGPSFKKVPPNSSPYTSHASAKPSSRALPMRPIFFASPMTLTFTPACSSLWLREFSGRDPIASTTESAGIVTSFPLESV
jgi:hypothetical protein